MALLTPGAAGARTQGLTYDQAVDQLIADGYPQAIETYLNSLGANPLGMRLDGTEAEQAASRYLAAELKAMGLSNVRLEPVPVDAYELGGASVAVGAREMTASQFPGIPGTPAGGIFGGVVYVHDGTAADFDAAGDVTGKIVLQYDSQGLLRPAKVDPETGYRCCSCSQLRAAEMIRVLRSFDVLLTTVRSLIDQGDEIA